jgi:polygalacturonase
MSDFRRTGILVSLSLSRMTLPCRAWVWDVTELGARGNKEANDTAAVQKAIDSASQTGGGVV